MRWLRAAEILTLSALCWSANLSCRSMPSVCPDGRPIQRLRVERVFPVVVKEIEATFKLLDAEIAKAKGGVDASLAQHLVKLREDASQETQQLQDQLKSALAAYSICPCDEKNRDSYWQTIQQINSKKQSIAEVVASMRDQATAAAHQTAIVSRESAEVSIGVACGRTNSGTEVFAVVLGPGETIVNAKCDITHSVNLREQAARVVRIEQNSVYVEYRFVGLERNMLGLECPGEGNASMKVVVQVVQHGA